MMTRTRRASFGEDLRVFENAARKSVSENIYVPAMLKLAAKVNGEAKTRRRRCERP